MVCFDEQVNVIGLNAELKKPEARVGGGGQGAADGGEETGVAQRRQISRDSNRDVDRSGRMVWRARAMRNGTTPRRRRSTGSQPTAAPCAEDELVLPCASHLD